MAFEFKITATLALDDLNRKDFSTMASSSDIATSTFFFSTFLFNLLPDEFVHFFGCGHRHGVHPSEGCQGVIVLSADPDVHGVAIRIAVRVVLQPHWVGHAEACWCVARPGSRLILAVAFHAYFPL